jgi:hypothetical protein
VEAHAASSALGTLHAALARAVSAAIGLALDAPPPWAALLLGAGLVFLLHGGRRRLPLALPGGALLGLGIARWIAALQGAPSLALEPGVVAATAGAFACAAATSLFPPLAAALPAAVVGAHLGVAGRAWLGAALAALAGAGVGALLREWVAAAAAGAIGAAAILGGALGLLARQPIAGELRERPWAVVALWVVLAVAGAAFHAGRAWKAPGAGRRAGDEIRPADRPQAGADGDA